MTDYALRRYVDKYSDVELKKMQAEEEEYIVEGEVLDEDTQATLRRDSENAGVDTQVERQESGPVSETVSEPDAL